MLRRRGATRDKAGAGDGTPTRAWRARALPHAGLSVYLFATFGVGIVLLSSLGWMAAGQEYRQDEREGLAALQSPADMQAQAIGTALGGIRGQVAAVLSSGDVDGPNASMCSRKLALVARIEAVPVSLAVLHRDGSVVCASDPRLQSPAPWVQLAAGLPTVAPDGQPLVEPGMRDLLHGSPAVGVMLAMTGTSPPAFFAATLPYASVFGVPTSSLPPGAEYLLLSADRATVYARAPAGTVRAGDRTGTAGVSRPLPGGVTSITGVDGAARWCGHRRRRGRVFSATRRNRAVASPHTPSRYACTALTPSASRR